jgi:hypothetical protein
LFYNTKISDNIAESGMNLVDVVGVIGWRGIAGGVREVTEKAFKMNNNLRLFAIILVFSRAIDSGFCCLF